ncbi:hypothetical protein HK104_010140 [Borealophlyctis nickersoniae]|nr:hypothetical protein HK104_010140 [Borealophlyctis nickersoniae]
MAQRTIKVIFLPKEGFQQERARSALEKDGIVFLGNVGVGGYTARIPSQDFEKWKKQMAVFGYRTTTEDENGENIPEEGYPFNPARGGHAEKDSGDSGPQEQDQEEQDYQNEFFDEETGELVSDSKYVQKQQSKQPRNSRKREYDAANYHDAGAISSRDGNTQDDDEEYVGDGETEDPRPRSDRSSRKKRRKQKKEEGEDIEKHDEWEGVGIEREDGDAEKQVDGQQQAKKERHMIEEQKKHQSQHPSKSTVDNVLWLLDQVYYSERYTDDKYEYCHVIFPEELLHFIPNPMLGRLLTEDEWRSIGIMQSAGWVHYMCHAPEPNIFLFQREKNYQQKYTRPQEQEDAEDQGNNQKDDDGVPTDQDEADDVAENEAEESEADGEAEVDAWDQEEDDETQSEAKQHGDDSFEDISVSTTPAKTPRRKAAVEAKQQLEADNEADNIFPQQPQQSELKSIQVQEVSCRSTEFKGYAKCRACIRENGDTCRFKNFRAFRMVGGMLIYGQPFFLAADPGDHAPSDEHTATPELLAPLIPQRTTDQHLRYFFKITANAFQNLIGREYDFLSRQPVKYCRPPTSGVRQSCDVCQTSIFNASYMCSLCGTVLCTDCFDGWNEGEPQKPGGVAINMCQYWRKHGKDQMIVVYQLAMEKVKAGLEDAKKWMVAQETPAPSTLPSSNVLQNLEEPLPFDIFAESGHYLRLNVESASILEFQPRWRNGEIVVVEGLLARIRVDWSPQFFLEKHRDDYLADVVPCKTGEIAPMSVGRFIKRFLDAKKRRFCPCTDYEAKLDEDHSADFLRVLPFKPYAHPRGDWNMPSRLPPHFGSPDLGPKMYISYGSDDGENGTTNLHLEMADTVNVMAYASDPPRPTGDSSTAEEPVRPAAAVWDIYAYKDLPAIRVFLKKYAEEQNLGYDEPVHDQRFYLNSTLRERLWREHGVRGWRVYQNPGDAVYVPAGCAHQVCNYRDAIKAAMNFVSPESVEKCEGLTHEFRLFGHTHRKKCVLPVKTIFWHAWWSCQADLKSWEKLGVEDKDKRIGPDEGKAKGTSKRKFGVEVQTGTSIDVTSSVSSMTRSVTSADASFTEDQQRPGGRPRREKAGNTCYAENTVDLDGKPIQPKRKVRKEKPKAAAHGEHHLQNEGGVNAAHVVNILETESNFLNTKPTSGSAFQDGMGVSAPKIEATMEALKSTDSKLADSAASPGAPSNCLLPIQGGTPLTAATSRAEREGSDSVALSFEEGRQDDVAVTCALESVGSPEERSLESANVLSPAPRSRSHLTEDVDDKPVPTPIRGGRGHESRAGSLPSGGNESGRKSSPTTLFPKPQQMAEDSGVRGGAAIDGDRVRVSSGNGIESAPGDLMAGGHELDVDVVMQDENGEMREDCGDAGEFNGGKDEEDGVEQEGNMDVGDPSSRAVEDVEMDEANACDKAEEDVEDYVESSVSSDFSIAYTEELDDTEDWRADEDWEAEDSCTAQELFHNFSSHSWRDADCTKTDGDMFWGYYEDRYVADQPVGLASGSNRTSQSPPSIVAQPKPGEIYPLKYMMPSFPGPETAHPTVIRPSTPMTRGGREHVCVRVFGASTKWLYGCSEEGRMRECELKYQKLKEYVESRDEPEEEEVDEEEAEAEYDDDEEEDGGEEEEDEQEDEGDEE